MYKNKWNDKLYEIIKYMGDMVWLRRLEDGHEFTIELKEFKPNYREVTDVPSKNS